MGKRKQHTLLPHQLDPPKRNRKTNSSPKAQQIQMENDLKEALRFIGDHRSAWLDRLHAEYERTENPLCVWAAWQYARSCGMTSPPWVLEYFDYTADLLLSAENKNSDVARLLGFAGPSRKVSRFSEYFGIRYRDEAVAHVKKLMSANPHSRTVFSETAVMLFDRFGLVFSERTIRDWLAEEE